MPFGPEGTQIFGTGQQAAALGVEGVLWNAAGCPGSHMQTHRRAIFQHPAQYSAAWSTDSKD